MNKIMKNVLKIILVLVILIVMILVGVVGATLYKKWEANLIEQGNTGIATGIIQNNEEKVKEEPITCLFMGVNGTLTDFIMLGQYNPNTKRINMLSIPRDTQYKKAFDWKINSLYAGKYVDKTITAVEDITGIKVDHYVVFNTRMLRDVVDKLGGVTVDVPINMNYDDPEQNLHIHLTKGVQLLNGDKAEQFVRFRKNNDGTGYVKGDEDRIKAQQNFIKAMFGEVLSAKGISKIPDMVKIFLDGTKTDITFDTVSRYLDDAVTMKTEYLRMETLPGSGRMGPGPNGSNLSYFFHNVTKTKVLVDELFNSIDVEEDVTETEDEVIDDGIVRIEVLNANNTNKVLNEVVEKLKAEGFDVSKIGNYGSPVNASKIIDYGKGTSEDLEKIKKTLNISKIENQEESSSRVAYTVIISEKYK